MMLRDAITGTANPLRDLFDPHRKVSSVRAATTLLSENADFPLYWVADRVRGRDGSGIEKARDNAPGTFSSAAAISTFQFEL
jgi:hypothetical protein